MAGEEEVEYPTEYMNSLANTKQSRWEADSSAGVRNIRDGSLTAASFGDLPALAAYGSVFDEVRKIYLETMRGARADLNSVASGIKSSAKQMKDNDDAAGAAFLALWEKWESGPLTSTQNQDEASGTPAAQDAAADVEGSAQATPPADGASAPVKEGRHGQG